jgi:hypothetical protein
MKQLVFTLEVLASREKLWECLWGKTFPNALANLKKIAEA